MGLKSAKTFKAISDILSGSFAGDNKPTQTVVLNDKLIKTEYLFGTEEELRKARITIIEKNQDGDCLCQVNGSFLIDIDHVDIKGIK